MQADKWNTREKPRNRPKNEMVVSSKLDMGNIRWIPERLALGLAGYKENSNIRSFSHSFTAKGILCKTKS